MLIRESVATIALSMLSWMLTPSPTRMCQFENSSIHVINLVNAKLLRNTRCMPRQRKWHKNIIGVHFG